MSGGKATYAVIIAGGNGERFWPLSTPESPKQFLDIFGGAKLIRQAVDRLEGLFPPARVFVVTSARFLALTRAALPQVPPENIVGEPCRRDTAAAVATACALVMRHGGEKAVGCVLTADQLIGPVDAFQRTLSDAMAVAHNTGAIVTMGIVPTRPETGFGYVKAEAQPLDPGFSGGGGTVFHRVEKFVEKPDAETARRYLADGGYFWNAGMFVWRADALLTAFKTHASDFAPTIVALVRTEDLTAEIARIYPSLRKISFDYAVMESCSDVVVAESTFTWDDVGSWTSLENHFPQDAAGNTALGNVVRLDTANTVCVSSPGHLVAVMGLKDFVVVTTPAATLVCPKARLGELKRLVGEVQDKGSLPS